MTTFVKVKHRALNNQTGRTVLITREGSRLGPAIAKAFVTASAARVIIVGRRANILKSASKQFKTIEGISTKILSQICNLTQLRSLQGM